MSLWAAVGDISETKLVIEIFYRPPDQKEQLDCEMTVQIKQACIEERVVELKILTMRHRLEYIKGREIRLEVCLQIRHRPAF